jgi:(1->4)-alpha-D-glucan 1-alpha-D-glucosylmutase
MATAPVPIATYRLQFNSDFRFTDATALVEYLAKLGITDIYASPILASRKGSKHGYDATDSTQIDPDIGTPQEFEQLENALLEHGMRLILDIVPNHMAASSENRWWMDVLENGNDSVFASFFDIDWHPPARNLEGRVLLPVLGRPFGETLDRRELQLKFENGRFFVQYFDSKFPLMSRSYRRVLKQRMEELKSRLSEDSPAYQEYSGIVAALSSFSETGRQKGDAERRVQLEAVRGRLRRLASENSEVASFIEENVGIFNGKADDPASLCALERLLDEQHFRLAYWQDPNEGINYRRFFAISDLVGIRAEDQLVFDATHDQIFNLYAKGAIRGLRIDHIDGLRDPAGYLNRLQERLVEAQPGSQAPYVAVEKILSRGESLPGDWAVSGTTGYDYLNAANGLFVCPSGARTLERIYFDFISKEMDFADVVYEKKKLVMNSLLRVEMRSLGRQLADLAAHDRYARDILRPELLDALIEVTACVSIYRTYIRTIEPSEWAKQVIEDAIEEASRRRPHLSPASFAFLRDVLTVANPPHVLPEQREDRLAFAMRWQQFTGPIVAKGVEDTALYVYYPLLSLNEVGGNPEPSKATTLEDFAEFIQERQRHWPDSLNATSTHDTKLSEDVRARLDVLSEIPEEWATAIAEWARENEEHRQTVNGRPVPDANEEYLIYQALMGLWPTNPSELPSISRRLQEYAIKATREAMVHTRWTEPNAEHERAVCDFIQRILSRQTGSPFLESVARLHRKVAHAGAINGLGLTLLKIASPGVPDFYQGSELWNLSLVDPDNRRPVDFSIRTEAFRSLIARARLDPVCNIREMWKNWSDGGVKLFTIWKALCCRRQYAELFREGEFIPVEVAGGRSRHLISFLRQRGSEQALIAIPRWTAGHLDGDDCTLPEGFWADTALQLPPGSPLCWRNVFTGKTIDNKSGEGNPYLVAGEVLAHFPVALLIATPNLQHPM